MLCFNQWNSRTRFGIVLLVCIGAIFFTIAGKAFEKGSKNDEKMQLKIMTFNIHKGGELFTVEEIAKGISLANADIAGIQEPYQSLPKLAKELGYYYSKSAGILSRFPIVNKDEEDFVYVEVTRGKAVAVSNVHLPAAPYMPYLLRDKEFSVSQVYQYEKTGARMKTLESRFESLPKIASKGMPVFLIGDFNSPSHLDWTDAAKANHYGFVVKWPISLKLEQLGFHDSYREIHPNPVEKPAYTWNSGYPGEKNRIEPNEKHDRIDFVYHSGPSKVKDSKIVGEPGPYSELRMIPWPSDHRAVVSTFEVVPASIPRSLFQF